MIEQLLVTNFSGKYHWCGALGVSETSSSANSIQIFSTALSEILHLSLSRSDVINNRSMINHSTISQVRCSICAPIAFYLCHISQSRFGRLRGHRRLKRFCLVDYGKREKKEKNYYCL
jgi:hypothetical protein